MNAFLQTHPKWKAALEISAKQAVRAVIGNTVLSQMLPGVFHFHNAAGMWNFGKAAFAIMFAAECQAWIPKLYAWMNSPTPGMDDVPPAKS